MASTASMLAYMSSGVPVFQPSHLEGDPSLATEILPGPPSVASAQQSMLKRDPRKPSTVFSYLPPSDPGSTYSGIMHGTLIGHEPDASRLKRSKTAIGRAQRASARSQNGVIPAMDPSADNEPTSAPLNLISVDLEPDALLVEDEPSSRSNSSQNPLEGPPTVSASGRPRRKDKGKAKEVELTTVKVKEEPKVVLLHTPDPPVSNLRQLNNDDHCSSCRSFGALVYCDGCPRAFHLWCLDPPMESVDEGDSRWFCPSCNIRKHPPRKPPPSLLSPLIQQVDSTIPTEFQLPEDVRTFFKDVGTGPKGTYVDTSEIKPPRLNRHGQLEDRDAHRLRDRNGTPVLCFRCGTSALPTGLAAASLPTKRRRPSTVSKPAPEAWKSIISCDYCSLHWHLDCLDPPLSTMPPFTKKWMCPNHAERILLPKRRIPKQNVPAIEITKPRQFNNGNIEVIHPESTQMPSGIPKVSVDEVLINGRRYRVPERIIVLDFWNKLNKPERRAEKEPNLTSGMSSPLTSLSSLDDLDDQAGLGHPAPSYDPEELKVAQLLCSLQISKSSLAAPPPNRPLPNGSHSANLTKSQPVEPEHISSASRVIKLPKVSSSKLVDASTKVPTKTPGSARKRTQRSNASKDYQPASTTRRRPVRIPAPPPELSTRELRSRSKNNLEASLTSLSSRSSLKRADDFSQDGTNLDGTMSARLPPVTTALPGRIRPSRVKVEETDSHLSLADIPIEPSSEIPTGLRHTSGTTHGTLMNRKDLVVSEVKDKRGRKRKERDEDLLKPGNNNLAEIVEKPEEKKERRPRHKNMRTPAKRGVGSPAIATILDSSVTSTATPVTPSLKIRLPRLNNPNAHASPSISNINGDTPTRL